MRTYYVYILKCSDRSYYTGITNDLDRRIIEHNSGVDKKSYTFTRRPVELIYKESFQNPNDAIVWEKRIKGWSRKKKEALIDGDFKELKRLSNLKSHTSTGSV
jgi:putative endonuclease